eukprot:COSAG01_NODE_40404_length_464_cov_0.715068_1_plen_31_part_10
MLCPPDLCAKAWCPFCVCAPVMQVWERADQD